MKHKDTINNQMKKSLKQEQEKKKDKFSRADVYFQSENDAPPKSEQVNIDKVVREGYSLLKSEIDDLEAMRFSLTKPDFFPTKSEVFRAMILLCKDLPPSKMAEAIKTLKIIKLGRKGR